MEIERTDIANQFYKGMVQAIIAEEPHQDPIAREDSIWYRLNDLVEENAITVDEAQECFGQYIQSVRPDVRVIHLGQTVSKPFYE